MYISNLEDECAYYPVLVNVTSQSNVLQLVTLQARWGNCKKAFLQPLCSNVILLAYVILPELFRPSIKPQNDKILFFAGKKRMNIGGN